MISFSREALLVSREKEITCICFAFRTPLVVFSHSVVKSRILSSSSRHTDNKLKQFGLLDFFRNKTLAPSWSSATAPASTAGQPVIPSGQHPGATAPLRVGFWGTMAAASKFRAKVVDQYTIGVLLELPKSIGLQAAGHQIGVRALYTEYDPISYQADYLREESGEGGGDGGAGGESAGHYINRLSVGGVCKVDLLSIPLRPKFFEKNQWSMRTLPAEGAGLTILPYPNPAGGMQQNLQPCKVEYRVPDHVVVLCYGED